MVTNLPPEVADQYKDLNLPPEVTHKFKEWDDRQRYNPVEKEKVEGNLRMTAFRRTIPITSHYFSNNNEREQPNR